MAKEIEYINIEPKKELTKITYGVYYIHLVGALMGISMTMILFHVINSNYNFAFYVYLIILFLTKPPMPHKLRK